MWSEIYRISLCVWTATIVGRLLSSKGTRVWRNPPDSGRFPSRRRSRSSVEVVRCSRRDTLCLLSVCWPPAFKRFRVSDFEQQSTFQCFQHSLYNWRQHSSTYFASARLCIAARPNCPFHCSAGDNRQVKISGSFLDFLVMDLRVTC